MVFIENWLQMVMHLKIILINPPKKKNSGEKPAKFRLLKNRKPRLDLNKKIENFADR